MMDSGDRARGLSPFDELHYMDACCRAHGEDMKQVAGPDPMEGLGDPIDGVPRAFPTDVEEPLPDLL